MKFGIKMLSALALIGAFTVPHLAGASPARALPTIFVALNGKSVNVSGTLVSGGVNLRITTTGEQEGELTLIHLKPGMTLQQVFAHPPSQDPNSVSQFGSIRMDASAPRGTTDVQSVLPAGNYIAFDSSNENVGPAQWPKTTFALTASPTPAQLPPVGVKYNIIDFRFQGPATFHRGQQVRIHNSGWVVHMFVLVGGKAGSRATAETLRNLLLAGRDQQARRIAGRVGFLSGPVSHGATQQVRARLQPGFYVLACFMDTQDHREHVQLGMLRIIQVLP